MNTFRYLKRNCPICEGDRSDCRQNQQTAVVHCRSDNANPDGWSFIGEDAHGFYMWAMGNRSAQFERRERQEAPHQPVKVLGVTDRDRQFKKIARHCGLSSRDRSKLEARMLDADQIERGYQRSLLWSWSPLADIPGVTVVARKR